MADESKLVDEILTSATEQNDKKSLSCAKAFDLAERFNVAKRRVRELCDENNVRIVHCQLGCFK